jgi:hypothetical protein
MKYDKKNNTKIPCRQNKVLTKFDGAIKSFDDWIFTGRKSYEI